MRNMEYSTLYPPKLPSAKAVESSNAVEPSMGRGLIDAVRALERMEAAADGAGFQEATTQLLSALSDARLLLARRGLLRGDSVRAEALLTKTAEAGCGSGSTEGQSLGQYGGGGRGGRKKRRKGGASGAALSVMSLDGRSSNLGRGVADDEGLLLVALGRMLGSGKKNDEQDPTKNGGQILRSGVVVSEAAEVLLVLCRHTMIYLSSGSSCASAESEMLLPACPQLLSGLGRSAEYFVRRIQSSGGDIVHPDMTMALSSCHRAAAAIITLMGTRLSRSNGALGLVTSTALETLFLSGGVTSECVQSGASLLASCPLAGNADGAAPAQLWTKALEKATDSLTSVVNLFFPIHQSGTTANQSMKHQDTGLIKKMQSSLISQTGRCAEFQSRVEGYALLISSLLDMDGCDARSERSIVCATLPLSPILDLIEVLFAFPSAAEAQYLLTKSRLRDVPVRNGYLSPNAAMEVANFAKLQGIHVFESVLSAIGSSGLNQGRRMMRLASNALQSSCSYALRRSIDPVGSPAVRADRKGGRRWLHNSLHLRCMTVRVFSHALVRAGPGAILASEGGILAKGLLFLSGCLLEQAVAGGMAVEDEWGTLSDRIELVTACADAVGNALSVAGAYLDTHTRATLESTASLCLSGTLFEADMGPALAYSQMKCALLRLAINCISIPWSDGAASNITDVVRQVATALKGDRDKSVAMEAFSAIGLCDALMAPRSPPLVVVTRSSSHGTRNGGKSGRAFLSTDDILSGIEAARKEVRVAAVGEDMGDKRKQNTELLVDGENNGEEPPTKKQKSGGDVIDKVLATDESKMKVPVEAGAAEAEIDEAHRGKEENALNAEGVQVVPNKMKVSEARGVISNEPVPHHANDQPDDKAESESVSKKSSNNLVKDNESDADSDESMGDLPEIVDCGPDDEDV